MATHKIIVEVNETIPQHPTQPSETTQATEVAPAKKVEDGRIPSLDAIAGAAAFNMGRSMALGAIARIGASTGDYYTQRLINNTMAAGQYIAAIVTNPGLGLAYTVMDLGFKTYDFQLSKTKANLNVDFYREKVGLAAISGTRYKGRKI